MKVRKKDRKKKRRKKRKQKRKKQRENERNKERMKETSKETRSDTRPIPVADGWAGAEMCDFTLFDSYSRTDQPTDGWTDGQRGV